MLALRIVVLFIARCLRSLRYRVTINGLDKLRGETGPILVLPNHPAYIDPPIVMSSLWPVLRPRPMVFAGMFNNPLLYPLIKILNALEIPNLDQASVQARQQAEQSIQGLIDSLRRGENCIMWPAGRVELRGVEVLGGVRRLTDILQAVPEAKVVLVRTRGLWGSRFSYAQTGKSPPLVTNMLKGALWLVANLWFFAPRRHVTITVEKIDRDRLPELKRDKINPWFEEWYNRRRSRVADLRAVSLSLRAAHLRLSDR